MAINLRSCIFNGGGALILHGKSDLMDGDLEALHHFSREEKASITSVVLSRTAVTGECFRHLACLPNLRALYANKTAINDNALIEYLPGAIQSINLDDTNIGDAGIAKLRALPNLCVVRLRSTNITNRGIAILASMSRLCDCDLDTSAVSVHTRQRLNNAIVLREQTFSGAVAYFVRRIQFALGTFGARVHSPRRSCYARVSSSLAFRPSS